MYSCKHKSLVGLQLHSEELIVHFLVKQSQITKKQTYTMQLSHCKDELAVDYTVDVGEQCCYLCQVELWVAEPVILCQVAE